MRQWTEKQKNVKYLTWSVRADQVWGHTPEQRVAAPTLRLYSYGLRLAIAYADASPVIPISFR